MYNRLEEKAFLRQEELFEKAKQKQMKYIK